MDWIHDPWPWYVAGPLIGLMVPLFMLLYNIQFGISSSLKNICAACLPAKGVRYFQYDWKQTSWNLFFVFGLILGGLLNYYLTGVDYRIAISQETVTELSALGISDFSGFIPGDVFNWNQLLSLPGFIMMVLGGFLVGFGTRYAEGCTSGHSITGLANLQWTSLVATIAFFAGGLVMTHLLLPLIL